MRSRGSFPSVVVTHPLGPLDNLALYRLIGGVFGRETPGRGLVRAIRGGIRRKRNPPRTAFPPRRVLYLI